MQQTEHRQPGPDRDEPQIGFRVREEADKTDFIDALKKQRHITNVTVFFQSVIQALKDVSDRDELVEWPIELVTKHKKRE